MLPAVAIALGAVNDPGAVSPLERRAGHRSPNVRARALSALAKYCSLTTMPLALQGIRDVSDPVRWSATHYISSCGSPDDASVLFGLTSDRNDLVRLNALKGLIRLRSTLACNSAAELERDPSLSVRVSEHPNAATAEQLKTGHFG
jgi:HEAT repeat protein